MKKVQLINLGGVPTHLLPWFLGFEEKWEETHILLPHRKKIQCCYFAQHFAGIYALEGTGWPQGSWETAKFYCFLFVENANFDTASKCQLDYK